MQNYKKLIGSISIITFSYAASRMLGFFREILLANWAGVSKATDTLDLAFIIPDFLFYLSAGGYLAITLIPIMSKKDKEELEKYFLSILYGLSIVFVLFSHEKINEELVRDILIFPIVNWLKFMDTHNKNLFSKKAQ